MEWGLVVYVLCICFLVDYFGKDFNHVGPAWWTPKGQHGLFPLYGQGENFDYIGPFWRYSREGNPKSYGIFPVAYMKRDKTEHWVWPFYSHEKTEKSTKTTALTGLVKHQTFENGDYKRFLHPLFYQRKKGESKTTVVVPAYLRHEDEDQIVKVNPLYGTGTDKNGNRFFTSVLGPLYIATQDTNQKPTTRNWYWLALAHYRTAGEEQSMRLWPIWAWSEGKHYPDILYNWTLAGYRKQANSRAFHFTPFIGHSYRDQVGKNQTWYSRTWAWPLLSINKSPHYSRHAMLLHSITKRYEEEKLREVRGSAPLGLVKFRKDVPEEILTWEALYGAINYKRDRERNRFSILKYLYRRDQQGEQTARDIFPFIRWDSGPERNGFSLLWRLVNVESTDEGTRGHLLFVPFGK